MMDGEYRPILQPSAGRADYNIDTDDQIIGYQQAIDSPKRQNPIVSLFVFHFLNISIFFLSSRENGATKIVALMNIYNIL
jgi:hypothetical protein